MDRRLYEMARKHVGQQPEWRIGLEKLARKTGSSRGLRAFKHDLLQIIERDTIPDYRLGLEIDSDGGRSVVVIEPRVCTRARG